MKSGETMNSVQRLLLFVLSLLLAAGPVFAQKTTPTPTPPTKVEYTLPYPGILPDHPLFMIKNLRDKFIDFLTLDGLRKSEFYLLQADKRLGMGKLLLEQGKVSLGEKSIEMSQTFMRRAVDALASVKSGGREIPEYLRERLTNSMAKHQEVLTDLLRTSAATQSTSIQMALEVLQKTMEQMAGLK